MGQLRICRELWLVVSLGLAVACSSHPLVYAKQPRDAGEREQATGATCSRPADCATGFCVDGVCCDSICSDPCRACAENGSEGRCTTIKGKPRGGRPACAGDGTACAGTCNGQTNTCSYPGSETGCGVASCRSDLGAVMPASRCSGAGACIAGQTTICRNSEYCSTATPGCVSKVPADGSACSSAAACTGGNCSNGRCCAAGLTGCDDGCENLGSDSTHCGSCKNACAPGLVCGSGVCLKAPPPASSLLACVCTGSSCGNLATDGAHGDIFTGVSTEDAAAHFTPNANTGWTCFEPAKIRGLGGPEGCYCAGYCGNGGTGADPNYVDLGQSAATVASWYGPRTGWLCGTYRGTFTVSPSSLTCVCSGSACGGDAISAARGDIFTDVSAADVAAHFMPNPNTGWTCFTPVSIRGLGGPQGCYCAASCTRDGTGKDPAFAGYVELGETAESVSASHGSGTGWLCGNYRGAF